MLLAVEGGGFFSSSASGYSKGLTLLLLGQKNEERPMRVAPWNQYQLVDRKSDRELQLASRKKQIVHGCASFLCFGHAAAGVESPSPLKTGPTQHQDTLPTNTIPVSGKGKDRIHSKDLQGDGGNSRKFAFRSNLRKPTNTIPVSAGVVIESEALYQNTGKGSNISGHMESQERRTVQWTDISGGEIAEIREFEPSDVGGSDDEIDNGAKRRCSSELCSFCFQ